MHDYSTHQFWESSDQNPLGDEPSIKINPLESKWSKWCCLEYVVLLSFNCCFTLVHLGSGLWATMAGPIFQKDTGVLYNASTKMFRMFGWHLLAGIAVFVWSGLCVFVILILFVCTRIAKHSGREGRFHTLGACSYSFLLITWN